VAATGQRVDPYSSYNFLVEIDGVTQAGFSEVSGFDATVAVHEYREGSDPTTVRKLPGMVSYANIALRWGLTQDSQLYDWLRQAADGQFTRKNGSIVVLDTTGQEVVRWNFRNAWPTRWSGPDLSAAAQGVAIQTLELVHKGVERAR
jgi:phage tail-like protein